MTEFKNYNDDERTGREVSTLLIYVKNSKVDYYLLYKMYFQLK